MLDFQQGKIQQTDLICMVIGWVLWTTKTQFVQILAGQTGSIY
jgi:hypothetical protein